MAKKAKAAAPVKPEKTATRTPATEEQMFQIEKLGKVISWKVPPAPYKGDPNLRAAFVGGARARAEQVNQAATNVVLVEAPLRFPEGSKEQQAFADGYHEAARQDGQHLKPRGLTGSTSAPEPPATSRGKRR